MIIVKDSMVLIHLAKTSLLEPACNMFGIVLIPELVHSEILLGKDDHPQDVEAIQTVIKEKRITVKSIRSLDFIRRANQFNIQGGEAESVALYWQEQAAYLATDDDNVRKKKEALKLNLIGTPAIMIRLIRDKQISKNQYLRAVKKLKEVGWFGSTVYDVLLMEVAS